MHIVPEADSGTMAKFCFVVSSVGLTLETLGRATPHG